MEVDDIESACSLNQFQEKFRSGIVITCKMRIVCIIEKRRGDRGIDDFPCSASKLFVGIVSTFEVRGVAKGVPSVTRKEASYLVSSVIAKVRYEIVHVHGNASAFFAWIVKWCPMVKQNMHAG